MLTNRQKIDQISFVIAGGRGSFYLTQFVSKARLLFPQGLRARTAPHLVRFHSPAPTHWGNPTNSTNLYESSVNQGGEAPSL